MNDSGFYRSLVKAFFGGQYIVPYSSLILTRHGNVVSWSKENVSEWVSPSAVELITLTSAQVTVNCSD